ncbi:MAG: envelope stress response membrane protein PspB [Novosphingobium sp.]
MEAIFVPLMVVLIAVPWIVLHYMPKWKTAPTLTQNDETLLEELYQLARRLEDRMDTVERLVAADNPDFRQARQLTDGSSTVPTLDDLATAPSKLRSGR